MANKAKHKAAGSPYTPPPLFAGSTFDANVDEARLGSQFRKVRDLMLDSKWRTLGEIREAIGGGSEAGISARLRDMRKAKFGSYLVERRRRGHPEDGLHEYRVTRSQ